MIRGVGRRRRSTESISRSFGNAAGPPLLALVLLIGTVGVAERAAAGPTPVPGLLDDAEVARDVRGIAHINQRDVLILLSLREALDRLASPEFAPAFGGSAHQGTYRWGKLHRIVFEHPLDGPFSVPPAGGSFPPPLSGLEGIPIDGGLETVDASSHDARGWSVDDFMFGHGPARRFVAEVSPSFARTRWVSSLPGGTSGWIGDPHHVDLLPAWLTNESYPQFLRRSDMLPTLESIERFTPV